MMSIFELTLVINATDRKLPSQPSKFFKVSSWVNMAFLMNALQIMLNIFVWVLYKAIGNSCLEMEPYRTKIKFVTFKSRFVLFL